MSTGTAPTKSALSRAGGSMQNPYQTENRMSSILLYGVLPRAAPQFVSFALYRWERSRGD